MTIQRVRRLAALNVVLLVVLLVLVVAPGGSAAARQPDRARGNYTMVSGRVVGSTTHAVYILDSGNQELVALSWDRTQNRLMPLGYRNLTADGKQQRGSR